MVVTMAWRRSTVLHQNAMRFKWRADALQYLYTLLTLATTCVTVVYAYLNNQSEKMRTLIAGLGGNSTNAEDTG